MFKALLSRLQAQDAEERERWIRALEDTVVRHNQLRWTASSGRIVGCDNHPGIAIVDSLLGEIDDFLTNLLIFQLLRSRRSSSLLA